MRSLKIIAPVLMTLALLLITSCTGKEKGIEQAREFVKAWNDTTVGALDKQVATINQVLDSLTFKSPFTDAFIAEVKNVGDSVITLAANVLLKEPDEISQDLSNEIIDGLSEGKLNYTQANAKIIQLFEVCDKLGNKELKDTFGATLDKQVASLSIDKQMKVYSSATTPDKLGKALRADAQTAGADKELINKQVDALKGIYSEEDFKKFNEAYTND